MKISHSLIKDFSILILTGTISAFVGAWLLIQYQQPQVVCYTDETYQKTKDSLVGTIYFVNEGRLPETNLSISIGEKLLTSDIDIAYLSTKAEISNEDNKTQITIPKLKPHESAEIVFRSRGASETFKIIDATSDSGNIRYEVWIKSWWSFTKLQLGIILLVVTVVFGLGFLIGSIKNSFFTKKAKPNRATRK